MKIGPKMDMDVLIKPRLDSTPGLINGDENEPTLPLPEAI
jgi:hypothetical protein